MTNGFKEFESIPIISKLNMESGTQNYGLGIRFKSGTVDYYRKIKVFEINEELYVGRDVLGTRT